MSRLQYCAGCFAATQFGDVDRSRKWTRQRPDRVRASWALQWL